MKKFALVDLKGGLGNQIFILCFAYHLKNNNYLVALDTNFFKYEMEFPRELEIDLTKTNLRVFNFKNNKLFFFLNTWFEEVSSTKDLNTRLFNRFTGYYQDLNYLNESKEKIISTLGIKVKPKIENSCMIHIRKGDYLNLGEDLKDSYYIKSINQLLNKNPDTYFDIFTDEPDPEIDNKIFKNVNNVYPPVESSSPIDTIQKMIEYQHYIIANSSFSLISAFLGSNDKSEVFYPNPWWKNFDVTVKNIPSSWTKVENF